MKRLLVAAAAVAASASGRTDAAVSASSTAAATPSASTARPSGTSTTNPMKNKARSQSSPIEGPYIPKSAMPASDKWVSIEEGVEFLPAEAFVGHDTSGLPPSLRRHLRSRLGNPYSVQPFVNGESEYDEYQQAWRYLGFVVDCDSTDMDDDSSWDGGTGEGCQRYLIWAAYVDLEYEGGGIGEYQYWDRDLEAWDDTPCKYAENGVTRCAKMDCHLDDTHFAMLGFFKHISYDDWMEQLFKHEGYCVWSEEEYVFMNNARESWPQGCDYAGESGDDGSTLYYDLKPLTNGGMTIGLYTDTKCTEDYSGTTSVEDVLGNVLVANGGSGDYNYDFASEYATLDESMEAWDSAFEAWRICQPCLAHDLQNVGYNFDDDSMKGENYGKYTYGNDDDYNGGYNGGGADFDCYDQADYTNVNQCMKFMAKTSMKSATFRDLSLASLQSTLVEYVTSEGYSARRGTKKAPSPMGTSIFFAISSILAAYGGFMFYKARKDAKNMPQFLEQPLNGVFT